MHLLFTSAAVKVENQGFIYDIVVSIEKKKKKKKKKKYSANYASLNTGLKCIEECRNCY